MKKSLLLTFVTASIAIIALGVWFFAYYLPISSRQVQSDVSSGAMVITGQTASGVDYTTIIGYSDEGDSVEDIGLGDDYTSPWFADIALLAGEWVELVDQGDNNFMRQERCWIDEKRENTIRIFTTDTKPSQTSERYIRFDGHKAQEYSINDLAYDGDDHSRFVIKTFDILSPQDRPVLSTFRVYRESPELIQLRDQQGTVTWYTSKELKGDYTVSECVKE